MPLITKAEASRALGVTPAAVYRAVKEGRLSVVATRDGRELINTETMRDEWDAKTQRKIGRGPKPPAGESRWPERRQKREVVRAVDDVPDYNESRARTEYLKAELLEIERAEKEGRLVDAEQVAAKWGELVAIARTKIMGVPSKAKQRMPDLSADDAALLEEIVREALEDLAGG